VALSVADARGLMQLIPSTAQEVADRLGWPNYQLSDLFRPIVNIPFGSYYLNNVRNSQGGSVEGALLSYNAGPGAAYSWIQAAGGDLDRLYVTIEYEETQRYLEFIHANYVIYQYLYGNQVPDCMFQAATA
jgi:soluble lytic murein transglycosylase